MKKILLSLSTVPLLSTSCFDNRLSDLDWIETTTETGFEYEKFRLESYDPDNKGINSTTPLMVSNGNTSPIIIEKEIDDIIVEYPYTSSGKLVSTYINGNNLEIINNNNVKTNITIKDERHDYLYITENNYVIYYSDYFEIYGVDGTILKSFDISNYYRLGMNADDEIIFSNNNNIKVINLESLQITHSFELGLDEETKIWPNYNEKVVITNKNNEEIIVYDFNGNILHTFDYPKIEFSISSLCYSDGRLNITSAQQSSTIQSKLYSFYSFKVGEEDFIGKTKLRMFSCGGGYVNFDDYWNTDDEYEQLVF